jgi:Ca2+-dependent lipid-binding protein
LEPLLDYYKPPGLIKRIYFKKLTFGDSPPRVEGIRVDRRGSKDEVKIEIDFRWASDASIFLAIELPAGGSATRMVPKISNLAVSGTIRIILKPLLPVIPGFGAVTISLMKQPIVKFNLNFGKAFGGSLSATAIRSWLDPFLRSTVAQMMLWPRRMVIPVLDNDVTGPLDELFLRHKGALQVDVIEAQGLPKMDTLGTADPFVSIYTQMDKEEKTTTKKNTLTPTWNERLWLLVQEPETQMAYTTCYDVDFVNVKELFKVNVIKGAASVLNAKEMIGRCMLRVRDYAERPEREFDVWAPLGLRDFSDEDGCVSVAGLLFF